LYSHSYFCLLVLALVCFLALAWALVLVLATRFDHATKLWKSTGLTAKSFRHELRTTAHAHAHARTHAGTASGASSAQNSPRRHSSGGSSASAVAQISETQRLIEAEQYDRFEIDELNGGAEQEEVVCPLPRFVLNIVSCILSTDSFVHGVCVFCFIRHAFSHWFALFSLASGRGRDPRAGAAASQLHDARGPHAQVCALTLSLFMSSESHACGFSPTFRLSVSFNAASSFVSLA
jgi:hypothetical protein